MKAMRVAIAAAALTSASGAVAYDSREVGLAAGKYIGTAVAIDYFFDKTACPNLMFGMRTKNRRMQDFVIEDINKLLSSADRVAFQRIKEPAIIKNMQRDGGEAFLRIYNSKKIKIPRRDAVTRKTF